MPPYASSLTPLRLFAWLCLSLASAVLVSWISIQVQQFGLAPVGVFSVLTGAVMGGAMVAWLYLLHFGHRLSAVCGAIVVAAFAAFAQHSWAFVIFYENRRQALQQNPQAALFLEQQLDLDWQGFTTFMRNEASREGAVLLWSVDAALIILTATVLVFLALRRPYADCCRRWYGTVREGHLDHAEALPEELQAASEPQLPRSGEVHYRLLHCRCGCGPLGVELRWKAAENHQRHTAWLTGEPAARVRVRLEEGTAAQ